MGCDGLCFDSDDDKMQGNVIHLRAGHNGDFPFCRRRVFFPYTRDARSLYQIELKSEMFSSTAERPRPDWRGIRIILNGLDAISEE